MPMSWRRILGIQYAAAGVVTIVALLGWDRHHAAGALFGALASLAGTWILVWRDRHAAVRGAATVGREASVAMRAALERLTAMTALLGFGLLAGWFPPAAMLAGFIAVQLAYVVSVSVPAGRTM
jgi:hypothetical protein